MTLVCAARNQPDQESPSTHSRHALNPDEKLMGTGWPEEQELQWLVGIW